MLPHEIAQSQALAERSLLSRVLGWLGLSLLLTAVGVLATPLFPIQGGLMLVVFIVLLGMIFGIQAAVAARRQELAVGLFVLFAFVEGLFIGPVVNAYLSVAPDVVGTALLGTVGIFLVAGAIVWITSFNFAAWGKWLFGALLVGIVLSIGAIFFRQLPQLAISALLGVVFVGLTFFDFWRVKAQRSFDNSSLLLALSLYLDFINLFLILLRLLGRRR